MLTVDFDIVQSCDCSTFNVVDNTNVGVDNPVALFSNRQFILTLADGTQTIYPFPFTGGAFSPILPISEDKDFAATGSIVYTAISPVTGTIYNRDKNIVSTCRADKAAQDKAKRLLTFCDKKAVMLELQDLNAGITSAIRLTQLGDLEDAQSILDYLHNMYGGGCGCGCN